MPANHQPSPNLIIVASNEVELRSLVERSQDTHLKKQLALIHGVYTITIEKECKLWDAFVALRQGECFDGRGCQWPIGVIVEPKRDQRFVSLDSSFCHT